MKLVKISAIAFAMSAMIAGPVLAQGASSGTQMRGGMQDRSGMQERGNMQGGASGSEEEEYNEQQGAPGQKTGVHAKAGAKGTVGASRGAKGTGGMAEDPAAGGKRQ